MTDPATVAGIAGKLSPCDKKALLDADECVLGSMSTLLSLARLGLADFDENAFVPNALGLAVRDYLEKVK